MTPKNIISSKLWDFILKWFAGKGVVYEAASEYVYTGKHFILLVLAIIATVAVFFIYRKKPEKTVRRSLVVAAYVMMACEILSKISKLIYFADLGKLTFAQAVQVILPIHFCSIIIWVLIFAILFDNKAMISFGGVCGLLGTLVYLLYPAEGLGASFIHFRAFSSIFTHSLGFVVCFNMFAFKMIKLELKDMWKTFVLLASMVIYCLIMNILFPYDANGNLNNYLFMIKNPTTINTGIIPYQLVFAVVAVVFFASMYLIPHYSRKIKQKRNNHINNAAKEISQNNE